MDKELKLTCYDFISVNHNRKYRAVKKGNKYIVQTYKPDEVKRFEKNFGDYVKQQIVLQKWVKPPKDKLIFIDCVFYFERIDMDCNNYFKTLFDTLTKSGVWEDDNITMERVNRIYYDSKEPRIELTIHTSDYIGIFDTKKDYEDFTEEYCNRCKNYKRGRGTCKIYQDCIANKINENFEFENRNYKCNKFDNKK